MGFKKWRRLKRWNADTTIQRQLKDDRKSQDGYPDNNSCLILLVEINDVVPFPMFVIVRDERNITWRVCLFPRIGVFSRIVTRRNMGPGSLMRLFGAQGIINICLTCTYSSCFPRGTRLVKWKGTWCGYIAFKFLSTFGSRCSGDWRVFCWKMIFSKILGINGFAVGCIRCSYRIDWGCGWFVVAVSY